MDKCTTDKKKELVQLLFSSFDRKDKIELLHKLWLDIDPKINVSCGLNNPDECKECG